MALFFLACSSLSVNPERVHLIDTYPRNQPHNYLFRGNNPVVDGTFNFTALVDVMRQKDRLPCGARRRDRHLPRTAVPQTSAAVPVRWLSLNEHFHAS